MSSSSTSINNLADDSLAHIFSFLPPDERVRLERVCRKWQKVAKSLSWTKFRKLDGKELAQKGDMLAKYRALIDRCAPHLRELSTAIVDGNVGQWSRMRNLRHLRFDGRVSADTLRAVAENLTHLQSIHISDIDWLKPAELRNLLRANSASLQALRFPVSNSEGAMPKGALPVLPSSLRSLHISAGSPKTNAIYNQMHARIDELLELAATCCPQLAILMFPMGISASLAKLAQFEKLFYLRCCFPLSRTSLFADLLAKIGAHLRALLLGMIDSTVLRLIATHCPLLEHFSFDFKFFRLYEEEGLGPALQSVFQLAHLRSVSICYDDYCREEMRAQIMGAVNLLIAKGNIKYLQLSQNLPLSIDFISKLIQLNPKLRKLTCAIRRNQTPIEMSKLNAELRNMERPLELELYRHCPPELEMGKNSRVRVQVRAEWLPESINQSLLRQYWAQAMDSVPALGNLDD